MANPSQRKIEKVFEVLRKHYQIVPLEIFEDNPYKILISTLMSSRTNDNTTLSAALRLFKKAPNFKKLSLLSEKTISNLVYPVGFYKTKARQIKRLTQTILTRHKGKIPQERKELMELPGVGRKTANLVLNRAFKKPAIAVDTHVHRITNCLGWVDTKSPQETEIRLLEIIPEKYWHEANKLFVSLGRQIRSRKKLEEFFEQNKIPFKKASFQEL